MGQQKGGFLGHSIGERVEQASLYCIKWGTERVFILWLIVEKFTVRLQYTIEQNSKKDMSLGCLILELKSRGLVDYLYT